MVDSPDCNSIELLIFRVYDPQMKHFGCLNTVRYFGSFKYSNWIQGSKARDCWIVVQTIGDPALKASTNFSVISEMMPKHFGVTGMIQYLKILSCIVKQCMYQFSPFVLSLVVFFQVRHLLAFKTAIYADTFIGVGSDFLVKVLRCSGLWCLTVASLIFFIAQIAALNTENPHLLFLVSSFTGLGYGFLFGCFPSLVAEAFGVHGLSTNWGFMTLSPVLSGYIFNLFYGVVYDGHSIVKDGGVRECTEGLQCYRSAYLVTATASVLGLLVSLWCIRYTHLERLDEARKIEAEEREE